MIYLLFPPVKSGSPPPQCTLHTRDMDTAPMASGHLLLNDGLAAAQWVVPVSRGVIFAVVGAKIAPMRPMSKLIKGAWWIVYDKQTVQQLAKVLKMLIWDSW